MAEVESKPSSEVDYDAVLAFLRKKGYSGTEEILRKEIGGANLNSSTASNRESGSTVAGKGTASGDSSVLSSYKSEGDPSLYSVVYCDLSRFIESSLDVYRHELALILYPVFVHMYLELVYNGHEIAAKDFIARFGPRQENFYQDDIKKLSYITKREHMRGSELMENFRTSQFTVRMSRDTYTQLRQQKKFLSERKHAVLWNIIQEHLYLDVYEGIARNRGQINATAGGMIGEANRQANRAKIFYGLQREPDLSAFAMDDDSDEEVVDGKDGDKPKKKKPKKDPLQFRKQKTDPNAPSQARMPLPELRDIDKAERAKALKEISKRLQLSADTLPSICHYTVLNSCSSVCSMDITDDSSLIALGMADSIIKIWSLNTHKLKALKSADALENLNRDADDVLHRMMDESTSEISKNLHGHAGPVYGLAFSPDRSQLLSCSEDGTIRLWSLQTWTCLVAYKGHVFPVWQVCFASTGYYFASCGHDKTARLWTTDQSHCLRIFVGHVSDVDCIAFHPNSNYVASGSSDRSVRLWDCVSGSCVRLMTGHKAAVATLAFSNDGRFLISGGASGDARILLWDLAHGHLIGDYASHTAMISTISFSRENSVMATSSIDGSISLWNFQKFLNESTLEEVNVTHNPSVRTDTSEFLIATFHTKETPIIGIHFTRRNLLLSIGPTES